MHPSSRPASHRLMWSLQRAGAAALTIAALFTGLAAAASAAGTCSLAEARYTLRGNPDYSADFGAVTLAGDTTGRWPLALHVHSTVGGATPANGAQDVWLGVEQGNGYSYAELYAIDNPALHDGAGIARDGRPSDNQTPELAPMPLIFVAGDMAIPSEPPALSAPAPAFFMVPYLGFNLWYEDSHFSDQYNESNRERMPLAFFQLSGCASITSRLSRTAHRGAR